MSPRAFFAVGALCLVLFLVATVLESPSVYQATDGTQSPTPSGVAPTPHKFVQAVDLLIPGVYLSPTPRARFPPTKLADQSAAATASAWAQSLVTAHAQYAPTQPPAAATASAQARATEAARGGGDLPQTSTARARETWSPTASHNTTAVPSNTRLQASATSTATRAIVSISDTTPYAPATALPLPTTVVKAEWPGKMAMGDTDRVKISIIRDHVGNHVTQVERPGQEAKSTALTPKGTSGVPATDAYGPDYVLVSASAVLESVNFDVEPVGQSEQAYPLEEDSITWQWIISPKHPGRQVLSADIRFQWRPMNDSGGPIRSHSVWQYTLDVEVSGETGLGDMDDGGDQPEVTPAQNKPIPDSSPSAAATQVPGTPSIYVEVTPEVEVGIQEDVPMSNWANFFQIATGLGAFFSFCGGVFRWSWLKLKHIIDEPPI